MFKLLISCALLISSSSGINHGQALADWNNWLTKYPQDYTPSELTRAQYYYNYNRNLLAQHNAQADRKQVTYRVAENQFSDLRLTQFAALLPQAVYPTTQNDATPVAVGNTPTTFDPVLDQGYVLDAADQGSVCSSSWAYATAKAVEYMNAVQNANMAPVQLSAQSLIDCAGSGTGCSTQVPQMAFDYLTQNTGTGLFEEAIYRNQNKLTNQGMCTPDDTATKLQLVSYGRIENGDDAKLMSFVGNNIPVIVEYNPSTFGFMHYSSGVYQPTATRTMSSQFLVVVGYGHDAESNLDYWQCLNSFGPRWGENGFIKIVRSASQPITKNAIFPNEFAVL